MPRQIAKTVIQEMGKLAQNTAGEMMKQLEKATLGTAKSGKQAASQLPDTRKAQQEVEKEIGRLRRNIEEEIRKVREVKKQKEKSREEEEVLALIEKQKEAEEKEAENEIREILPPGKQKRLPPWVQRGTRESGVRQSV